METFKEVLSVIGAVVGLVTALLPLFARFLDRSRQQAVRNESGGRVRQKVAREEGSDVSSVAVLEEAQPEPAAVISRPTPGNVLRAKTMVKAPATALMVMGLLGLPGNLFMAAFGFVDGFVAPLTTQSQAEWAAISRIPEDQPQYAQALAARQQNQAASVMAIVAFFTFALASGMAAWAGLNMMRLRSYWLSMAGSIAVMPAGFLCCFAGVPIGIWSVVTLLRPEVSSSFS